MELQLVDGGVEGEGRPHHLVLHDVEAVCHLAELIGGAHDYRVHDHGYVGSLEVVAGHGLHGCRQVGQRPFRQVSGRVAHLVRGVGDHSGQHEADRDGEQADGDEQILQEGD